MSVLTICSIVSDESDYLLFQDEIIQRLGTQTECRRLIGLVDGNQGSPGIHKLPGAEVFRVDMRSKTGGEAHGHGLNLLQERIRTPYGLFIDPDALPTLPKWDGLLMEMLNSTVVAVGTPYGPHLAGMRYQGLPNAVFLLFDANALREMRMDWRPLPFIFRRILRGLMTRFPKFKMIDFEVGWRLEYKLRARSLEGRAFDYITQAGGKRQLLRANSESEEFHLDGRVVATHLKGSSNHKFGITARSMNWIDDVRRFVPKVVTTPFAR